MSTEADLSHSKKNQFAHRVGGIIKEWTHSIETPPHNDYGSSFNSTEALMHQIYDEYRTEFHHPTPAEFLTISTEYVKAEQQVTRLYRQLSQQKNPRNLRAVEIKLIEFVKQFSPLQTQFREELKQRKLSYTNATSVQLHAVAKKIINTHSQEVIEAAFASYQELTHYMGEKHNEQNPPLDLLANFIEGLKQSGFSLPAIPPDQDPPQPTRELLASKSYSPFPQKFPEKVFDQMLQLPVLIILAYTSTIPAVYILIQLLYRGKLFE